MSRVAVLIPCLNEESTIAKVVADFRSALPDSDIHVYDNGSTDATVSEAKRAGAIVHSVPVKGKGNVLRSMFKEIEADIYIMVDGDDTYDANDASKLIELVDAGWDMVIGDRLERGDYDKVNDRPFHGAGNRLVRYLINKLFKSDFSDILSGYRALSRRFVKGCPITSEGFEVETEMTINALFYGFFSTHTPVSYKNRPKNSSSKLNTFRDGAKILKTIFFIFKDYKPLVFFSLVGILLFLFSLYWGVPVIEEYIRYKYVYKVPSAILATGLMLLSFLSFFTGIILDTIKQMHKRETDVFLGKR